MNGSAPCLIYNSYNPNKGSHAEEELEDASAAASNKILVVLYALLFCQTLRTYNPNHLNKLGRYHVMART